MNPHKINKYVPEFLREIAELKAVYSADDVQLDNLGISRLKVIRSQFIESADEEAISRYERMLKISPPGTDTLEDRRFRLRTYAADRRPYTERALYDFLTELCGEGNVSIDIDVDTYAADIVITAATKSQYLSAERLIESILPCNLGIKMSLVFERRGAVYIGGLAHICRTIDFPVCNAVKSYSLHSAVNAGGNVHRFKSISLKEG